MRKPRFTSVAVVTGLALTLLVASGVAAHAEVPSADLAMISIDDSPDPVVGQNTVEYTITVANLGPDPSGVVTVSGFMSQPEVATLSASSNGDITSVFGDGWDCNTDGPSYLSCSRASLDAGETAAPIHVLVLAPSADTTITLGANVEFLDGDPNWENNNDHEVTTVTLDAECGEVDAVSCGAGQITYGQDSQVTTGSVPSEEQFLVGTATFKGVSGASGGQVWSMYAPSLPERLCPVKLGNLALTQCTWQMNLDPIPAVYPRGNTTFVALCYVGRCPQGRVPGLGTVVVKVGDNGRQQILPPCLGLPVACFEQQRVEGGHLRITVRNLTSGDPRVAGICLLGGC